MTNNKLDDLLSGEEPKEIADGNKGFDPKFNVREEFAIWVREQFPQLKEYAKRRKIYRELETRKDEVYQAALGAVNHGTTSTEACALSRLRFGWTGFDKVFQTGQSRIRARSLEKFVRALEDLSISLGGDKHYTEAGKFLNGGGYSDWMGNLKAFIYMSKNENGEDKYLVFDDKQEFSGDGVPILIGEFMNLTKWKIENLRKIASDFKGPEKQFIEEIDRRVPEEGGYSYPSYYGQGYGSYYTNPPWGTATPSPVNLSPATPYPATVQSPIAPKYLAGKPVKITNGVFRGLTGVIKKSGYSMPTVELEDGRIFFFFSDELELVEEESKPQTEAFEVDE